MNRTQRLKMNTGVSLLNRIAILVSGLILPRLILLYYGSEINGLVSSITQFLSIIAFLDLGVGSVVQSALYQPLAKKDAVQTSIVLAAAKKYFRKIAYALVVYVLLLILFYPLITSNQTLDFLSTALLIIAISISSFTQYYFGIINEFLLNADQRGYIQLSAEIIVVILNLITSVFLITQGMSIQIVKISTSLIYLIRPIYLSYYVNKHYDLIDDIEVTEDPLPQKWSGMGQHFAYTVQSSTDVIVLTMFSTLENVSIYSVYNMVVSAVKLVVSSFTTGLTSFFGNLLANREMELLNSYFSRIEWWIHTGVIYLYGMTAVLITPFVMLYTSGITDVDYYAPVFSIVLVLSSVAYSLRTPYQTLVFAAGHFKQTQLSSIIEAIINIILSLVMINYFGLIGITFGTLASMVYRTVYLALYLSRNIINRPINHFIKHIIVDFISLATIFRMGILITNMYQIGSLIDWIIVAAILGIINLALISIINLIFYKDVMVSTVRSVLKRN